MFKEAMASPSDFIKDTTMTNIVSFGFHSLMTQLANEKQRYTNDSKQPKSLMRPDKHTIVYDGSSEQVTKKKIFLF